MENKKDSEKNELIQKTGIKKTGDTLLVLHHDTDTIKIVQGIDHEGNLKDIPLNQNTNNTPILIDQENQSFVNFYCDFYSQLKHPEEFSFFKVSEYEAVQTGKDLQHYIDHARPEDYKDYRTLYSGAYRFCYKCMGWFSIYPYAVAHQVYQCLSLAAGFRYV
ncbi:hypothetical protein VO54_03745 [Elizabethkingia miricola]|nr:hypothetical protein VO54_03745 [Elizabethkingia miricola]